MLIKRAGVETPARFNPYPMKTQFEQVNMFAPFILPNLKLDLKAIRFCLKYFNVKNYN